MTAATKVGINHLRSLGFKAGKKKARICHKIIGEDATIAVQKAILKRVPKDSKGVNANNCIPFSFCGKKSLIGKINNCPTTGAAA